MKQEVHPVVIFMCGMVVACVMSIVMISATVATRDSAREIEAIERGYALYCPKTGVWSWAGECE